MFGYVITNNNIGTESGFWSPFPRLVVWAHTKVDYLGKYGRLRNSWDYWSWREEINHRRTFNG